MLNFLGLGFNSQYLHQILSNMIKVNNANEFSDQVEQLHKLHKDLTYLEVIMLMVEERQMDIEAIPKLLNDSIKSKLEDECHSLNLLGGKLPSKLPLIEDD